MKKFLGPQPIDKDLAALFLRLLLGGLFIWHGYQKIEHYNEWQPMFTSMIGLGAKLEFGLLIFAEFGCGILVALGVFTRLSVLPILFAMLVAFFIAHKKDPFMLKELVFVFIVLNVIVFLLGSGKYSVDAVMQRRKA